MSWCMMSRDHERSRSWPNMFGVLHSSPSPNKRHFLHPYPFPPPLVPYPSLPPFPPLLLLPSSTVPLSPPLYVLPNHSPSSLPISSYLPFLPFSTLSTFHIPSFLRPLLHLSMPPPLTSFPNRSLLSSMIPPQIPFLFSPGPSTLPCPFPLCRSLSSSPAPSPSPTHSLITYPYPSLLPAPFLPSFRSSSYPCLLLPCPFSPSLTFPLFSPPLHSFLLMSLTVSSAPPPLSIPSIPTHSLLPYTFPSPLPITSPLPLTSLALALLFSRCLFLFPWLSQVES